MLVLKFGGSSVANAKSIEKVKNIIEKREVPYVVLVSALSGSTDSLEEIAHSSLHNGYTNGLKKLKEKHVSLVKSLLPLKNQSEILIYIQKSFNELNELCKGIFVLQELTDKSLAMCLSYGEMLSSKILHAYLFLGNPKVKLLISSDLIKANGSYLKGTVDKNLTNDLISKELKSGGQYVAPGFIASNDGGEVVLLGRGGSDYSAAIFANVLNSEKLEIWSDVNGMLNANPKIVRESKTIHQMDYKEAFEMSHFGAKVLFPPSIRPVMEKNIPVILKNTFNPDDKGTEIKSIIDSTNSGIKGVTSISNISLINISGVGLSGPNGSALKIFQSLSRGKTNVVLITQSCSEQSICIAVDSAEADKAVLSLNQDFSSEIECSEVNEILVESNYSIIALVGNQMKEKIGVSGQAFQVLGENGINIKAIAQGSSERNVSIVVLTEDENKAVNVLHESFFESSIKQVHLFIAGKGNVGQEFLKIIEFQRKKMEENHNVSLKLVGLSNSSSFSIFDSNNLLKHEVVGGIKDFVDKMKTMNLRNSVFIDNTASSEVASEYHNIFNNNISIVACNKIMSSSTYANVQSAKELAKVKKVHFKYEACVGAALPVVKTIQDLLISGDEIIKIEAVLSGSLNFIFNEYNGTKSFSSVVELARKEGYTEPNPLIDLSGVDVVRKILILAREAGYPLEMEDVVNRSFLPSSCLKNNEGDILKMLLNEEGYFKSLFNKAKENKNRLKVVATFDRGSCSVGLQEVSAESPFYQLEGKDNIVSIYTNRYVGQPLVIKGAGAGAAVTASGVFSDLMQIVNQ